MTTTLYRRLEISRSMRKKAIKSFDVSFETNNFLPDEITDEWLKEQTSVSQEEIDAYYKNIENAFSEPTIDNLLTDCRQKAIEAIVGPLGLGRFLAFYDKIGGNVDTLHNARNNVYATDEEKRKMENVKDYDSQEVHSDSKYKENRKKQQTEIEEEGGKDIYTDEDLQNTKDKDLDHIISAAEIHYDPARVLAEVDTSEAANVESNLGFTDKSINRSKGKRSVSEFIAYVNTKKATIQKQIDNLNNKKPLNENQQKELDRLENKLDKLEKIDEDLMRKADEQARKEYNDKLNKAYYTSKKFIVNTAKTSAYEGVKMGWQQAFGLLLYDLTNAIFDEFIDIWHNGLVAAEDNGEWQESIKRRLKKIGKTVVGNWKKVVAAFRDGFISGFISNLVTTLINVFYTTAKNLVRLIREGTMVLFRAAKSLLFPEEGKSTKETWDDALKVLVAGTITIAGIALQEVIADALVAFPFPGQHIIIDICVGLVTGVTTALAMYGLERMDPFGVRDEKRRRAFYYTLRSDEKRLIEMQEELYNKYCVADV